MRRRVKLQQQPRRVGKLRAATIEALDACQPGAVLMAWHDRHAQWEAALLEAHGDDQDTVRVRFRSRGRYGPAVAIDVGRVSIGSAQRAGGAA